ncbi:hypothetical protein MTO96_039650 [Rhipicephalus appendiculatus]
MNKLGFVFLALRASSLPGAGGRPAAEYVTAGGGGMERTSMAALVSVLILLCRLTSSTMLQASSAISHARQPNDTRRAVPVLNVASSWPFQPIFAALLQPEDAHCHLRSPFDGYLNCPPTLHPGVFAHVKHKNNVMGQCETFQCCAWTNVPPCWLPVPTSSRS